MISFNILGCCVSRDIMTPLIQHGDMEVLQYQAFSNILSVCSEEHEFSVSADDLESYTGSHFAKRCIAQDISKTVFDHIFLKKSDYIIIDILDARMTLLKKENYLVTLSNTVIANRERLNRDYGFDTYEQVSPFGIDDKQWEKAVDRLCEQLRKHYASHQIILHKFYGLEEFADKNIIKAFPKQKIDFVRKYNSLAKKLNGMLEEKLKGCHVIEFPENVIAVAGHKWGLNPLHYHHMYCEYGAEAIELITRNFPNEQEKAELSLLKAAYEEKFDFLLTKLDLNNTRTKLSLSSKLCDFLSQLALDRFDEDKLTHWLEQCAANNSKIAVLKAQDMAAKILLKALEKYKIETVLLSNSFDFKTMTEEELEKCRQADIIISAHIYGSAPITNGELSAIKLYDLIR